jgi:hypothetical protein
VVDQLKKQLRAPVSIISHQADAFVAATCSENSSIGAERYAKHSFGVMLQSGFANAGCSIGDSP